MSELIAKDYFEKLGFTVKKNISIGNTMIKDEIGSCDFTIISKNRKKFYVEVKSSFDSLSKIQLDFIKKQINKKNKILIFMISNIGAFIIFEVLKDLKLKPIDKKFCSFTNYNFYIDSAGKINHFDLRSSKIRTRFLTLQNNLNKIRNLMK